jgi:hypothetical protein
MARDRDDAPEEPSEVDAEEILEDETASGGRRASVLRFAKRLMDRRELAEDTRDLLYAVLTTSDKAKTEAVKMVAREVRSYLKELQLKEDLLDLARSHSLEISLRLKPLADAVGEPEKPGDAHGQDGEAEVDEEAE